MAGIYQSVTELIGRTPLLEVKNLEKELNLQARVLVKLEYFNPAGSVKDRAALQMITEAAFIINVFGDGTEVAGISQSIQYHKLDIIMLCQNVLDIIRADKPGCTGYEISLH